MPIHRKSRLIAPGMIAILLLSSFRGVAEPTEDAAIKRVEQTREFRRLAKEVKNPLLLATDDDGKDFREIVVYEDAPDVYHRCETFMVYDDGRIMIWDYDKDDWAAVTADGK